MASKEVKISFHILNICVASNSEEPLEEYPFSTIGQLLEYIRALGDDDKKQKFYDLKDSNYIEVSNEIYNPEKPVLCINDGGVSAKNLELVKMAFDKKFPNKCKYEC